MMTIDYFERWDALIKYLNLFILIGLKKLLEMQWKIRRAKPTG